LKSLLIYLIPGRSRRDPLRGAPPIAEQWYSIDGKTLRGSATNLGKSYQQFVQIVSVFSSQTGIVRGMSTWLSKENSEIIIIQNLVKVLKLEGVTFTLDALNCQKKLLR
jgi:hypothetical protein